MSEQFPEVPEADAAEQATPLVEEEETGWPARLPDDADEGDATEQVRQVSLGEDDYR